MDIIGDSNTSVKTKSVKAKINTNPDGTKTIIVDDSTQWNKPSTWCLPFIIYIVLSVIGIIISLFYIFSKKNVSTSAALIHFLFNIVYTILFACLIYYLCKKGYTGWAWFVLFLPLIISFIFTIFIFGLFGVIEYDTGTVPLKPYISQ
jgi:hypothetical protein